MPPDSTVICDSPADRGYPNSEQVHIRTKDGVTLRGFIMWPCAEEKVPLPRLHKLRMEQGDQGHDNGQSLPPTNQAYSMTGYSVQPRFVILYFHGNAGNVGHRIPIAALLTSQLQCVVLMMDYRGFGHSDSVAPTEEGLRLDAQACLDYLCLHPHIPSNRIYVMGVSLGGAVAIHLATQAANVDRIAGVIVENSFTSISDMSSELARTIVSLTFPRYTAFLMFIFYYYLRPLCLYIGWRSIDLVQRVQAPILFLSGLKDEIVPPVQMQQLFSKASGAKKKKMVVFEDGMHNDLPSKVGYIGAIESFVRDSLLLLADENV
ncbi:Bem46-like serine peptidase [Trypanosoma vivax]|nr:Bem46-like serine peptidase [Trypanosoma vivax]